MNSYSTTALFEVFKEIQQDALSFRQKAEKLAEQLHQQRLDDNEALYIVLRAAEYGCEQKFIKHVAGMLGRSWPAPDGDLSKW